MHRTICVNSLTQTCCVNDDVNVILTRLTLTALQLTYFKLEVRVKIVSNDDVDLGVKYTFSE